MSQVALQVPRNSGSARRRSSTVSKVHSRKRFSFDTDEPLRAAVAVRRADKGGGASDSKEAQLLPEGAGHVLPAVVVPHGEAAGDVLGETAEVTPHTLAGSRHRCGRRRLGSSASKRVARCAAWMPTHPAEQRSSATNPAAWPSPVQVVVRSVP